MPEPAESEDGETARGEEGGPRGEAVEHVQELTHVLSTLACPQFGLQLSDLEPIAGILTYVR